MTTPSSAAAFDALAVVVRDRGIDIADDSARLRGMLNDVLAADARVNRAAVDALVLAAEIGVPRDISSTPVADVPRLTAQLASRGVAPDLADQTVRAWITAAQGGRTSPAPGADASPITAAPITVLPSTVLPNALVGTPAAPAPTTPPPTMPPAAPAPTALPPTAPPPTPPTPSTPPTYVPPSPLAATPVASMPGTDGTVQTTSPSAEDDAPADERATAPMAPVLVPPPPPAPPSGTGDGSGLPRRTLLVLVAAIVAVVAIVGGALALGGGGGDDDAAAATSTAPPTSAAPTTTAAADVALEVLTPAAGTESATREVEMTGRTAPGAKVTVNGTAATVDATGNWKLTVSLPDPETKFAVVATTTAGASKTVEWTVKRDALAPSLEIVDPVDGAVLPVRTVELRGTTDHNSTVLVDGVGASGDASLSTDTLLGWVAQVTIDGDQKTFTVTSTDQAGNVATKTVTLRFQASAPPPIPRPTVPKPPTGGTGPTTPPPTTSPVPAIVARDFNAGNWVFAPGYYFQFNVAGSIDGTWDTIEYGPLSGNYGTLEKQSGGFFRYTMQSLGTESFQYRAKNSATGAFSNWATVTFTICNC
jgi:hypothetical protein